MEELKKCPFCGGVAGIGHHRSKNKEDEYYAVMCIDCFARAVGETVDEAKGVWNKRAGD